MVQHMDAEKTQNKRILVGMGEFAVSHNPHTLSCIGLGSCIGVALYDRISHMGGLAHIMLPDSEEPESKISNPLHDRHNCKNSRRSPYVPHNGQIILNGYWQKKRRMR